MNNNLRPTLWAMFAALLMMLWLKWDEASSPKPVAEPQQASTPQSSASDIPQNTSAVSSLPGEEPQAQLSGNMIHVKTDILELLIDTKGGSIVESKLLKYTQSVDDATPIKLFNSAPGTLYHFETGINSTTHSNNATHKAVFSSANDSYELSGESISVPLTWTADGTTVTKTFTFYPGRYDFTVEQTVTNNSGKDWNGYQYSQLKQNEVKVERGLTTFNTFAGAAYSTPEKNYNKLSFSDLSESPLNVPNVVGGWVGFMQHYFLGAIVPKQDSTDTFFSKFLSNDLYIIGLFGQSQSVASGTSKTFTTTGFVGPKIKDDLARITPNLDKATDYGFLFFISEILFNVLDWVHSVLKNWGWAIVVVTIGIKIILFPLAAKSFKSMAKMRKFQPEMDRIRKNCGDDDRQLVGKKMMELYKKEGINPASGCLPILVQIPIFLAFYYMLMESVELRQAPWIFWIKDLSVKDPFYVLPVLNMGLMFLQQRLNPPPSDPMQRKVMMFMPVVFGLLFLVFPAGLVLYWAVSNSFSIIQQYLITKRYGGLAKPLSHD